MIRLYGLAYYCDSYIKKSIESIYSNLDEDIEFIVVENKSKNSPQIKKDLQNFLDSGKIQKAYLMSDNSRGNALIDIVRLDPPTDPEDFFMITDLDLAIPVAPIISNTRKKIKEGYGITGLSLSTINYGPPNRGFDENGFGWWMLGLNKTNFFNLPKNTALTDSYLIANMGKSFKFFNECYHYSWDVWRDYPEYWEGKNIGIPWNVYMTNSIEEILE